MLPETDKKKLQDEIAALRKEIASLRTDLAELKKKREAAFSNKEEVRKDVTLKINSVKTLKKERDGLTREVRQLKAKRGTINDQIKGKVEDIKRLTKEKQEVVKKKDIKLPPSRIKQMIEKLEHQIETEALSFSKEQGLMKKIKELKKQYKEVEQHSVVFKSSRETEKELKKLRAESEKIHRELQTKAELSQKKHEDLIRISGEVDKLKKDEDDRFKEFVTVKEEYNKANEHLKGKLDEVKTRDQLLSKDRKEIGKKKEAEMEKDLQHKEAEVEEKIKKGKKLTTEDLLVLQRNDAESKES